MVTAELCTQHGARVTGGDAPGGRPAGSADADWRKAEDTGALPPALTPVGFALSLNIFFFCKNFNRGRKHTKPSTAAHLRVQFTDVKYIPVCLRNSCHLARWKLCPHLTLTPAPPSPARLPPPTSVSMVSSGALRKWDHAGAVLLRWAYFTEHSVFQVHPCRGR